MDFHQYPEVGEAVEYWKMARTYGVPPDKAAKELIERLEYLFMLHESWLNQSQDWEEHA